MNPRARTLNDRPATGTGPVVAVISRDQRLHDNPLLLEAQARAIGRDVPLVAVFVHHPAVGDRAREHVEFMVAGLVELRNALAGLHIPLVTRTGHPATAIGALVREVDASEVLVDLNPLRGPRAAQRRLARELPCTVTQVDAHNVVPVWVASPKLEVGARTLRPKIHRLLPTFLHEPEELLPHPHRCRTEPPSDPLVVDPTLASNGTRIEALPGERAAHDALERFVDEGLRGYATERNDPTADRLSGLSPYLHFGQLAPVRATLEVSAAAAADPTLQGDADVLVEELVIRRELSDNYCWYQPSYDSLDAAPEWARRSLDQHLGDPRDHVYSEEQFAAAATHDRAWNAAQTQLLRVGKIHGYMRMYWAKKVLEWTPDPETAIRYLIRLNDHWSIDGADPNGYAGILWSVGGVHDRPWFDRPVYGVVRYMNANGLRRKFDIAAYQDRWLGAGDGRLPGL